MNMKLIKFSLSGLFLVATLFLACGKKSSTGPGPAPATTINLRLAPASLNFGNVDLGATKDSTIVIENLSTSNAALTGNLSISGATFSVVGNDVSFNLSPGQLKSFNIRFSPASTGAASGAISVTHNANNPSSPSSVTLSGNGEDRTNAIRTLVQSAWAAFTAKDYNSAETGFNNAVNLAKRSARYDSLYAEAEGGRGWSKAYKRNFISARTDLSTALTHTQRSQRTDLNAKAGLALVHHALNEFTLAIQRALEVLNASPNYTFEHDNKVTHKRIRLLLAQSYYITGDFQQAAAQLDILDPAGAPHATDPDILLRQIQDLWGMI